MALVTALVTWDMQKLEPLFVDSALAAGFQGTYP